MRDLPHIIGQVFNTPLMIHTPKLDTVLGAVGSRILRGEALGDQPRPEPRAEFGGASRMRFESGGYLCDGGIAVLPVLGTLIRRGSWLDAYSGLTSYSAISSATHEIMQSPSVRGLMLEIDSFGGEAGGCFDLVEEIASIAASYEKPIWAIANEASASAAYALACAADRIFVPQMGVVGSIGVVCAHVDMSQADEMSGLKWTYVFAGEHKVDGNPHEPLPASVKADLLEDVNQIYHKFASMVADRRGLSIEAVRETEARMYRGTQAVEAGLADEIGTFAEAMNAFAEHLDQSNTQGRQRMTAVDKQRAIAMGTPGTSKPKNAAPKAGANAANDAADENAGAQVETVDGNADGSEGDAASTPVAAPPAAAPPVAAAPAAGASDAAAAATLAERKRVTEMHTIAAFASTHGLKFDVSKAIESGMSADAARSQVMSARASADEAAPIVVTPTNPSAAAASKGDNWQRAIDRAAARNGFAPVAK